jgi:probable biosynthetic protein (TIGR04099 family)
MRAPPIWCPTSILPGGQGWVGRIGQARVMTGDVLPHSVREHSSPLADYVSGRGDGISVLGEPTEIGMPHLAVGGLSENWLLKECGHRHWMLLAAELGLSKPDFRDADGNRLYAAFTAVRVCDAQLGSVREGDALRLRTSLGRISRTQWLSSHVAVSKERLTARVTMNSVFVRRTVAGSNRHVERAAVAASLPRIDPMLDGGDLARHAREVRSANWSEHFGFKRGNATQIAVFDFRPCPYTDFNGADFFYFASFQSLVDRAEWDWRLQGGALAETTHREIFYYGNIDIGDELRVVLRATHPNDSSQCRKSIRHWCQVYRAGDEKLIGDVFTAKRTTAADPRPRRVEGDLSNGCA